ncbi:MAG: insulinase family protein [Chloroflexi bacterium]|nr:insulinase family protein [Chloroflexota bacterium]
MENCMQNGRYPNSTNIQRQLLPNGVTVLVYENFASQSVVVEGVVRAGSLADRKETAGLARLTSSTLMRGTQQRRFDQIYEALESVGAHLHFSSGYHTAGFSAQGLVEDMDLLLDMAADVLRQPTFFEEQVNKVRSQILTILQMRANDTGQRANLAFHELLYGEHPYGRSRGGYSETVATLTRPHLADFHSRYYGPQGMIITVVGAVKAQTAVDKVAALFGDWHNEGQEALTTVPDKPRPEKRLQTHVAMPDKHQVDIRLGLPGPRRSAPDYLDASLMNTILGVFGMMGRIGQNVREEQGLAYVAYSQLQGGLGPLPWTAVAGVAPDVVDKAIQSILDEIVRIQDELVTAAELADSQAYRTGSMPMALETNNGLADIITDMELLELGLDYLLEYPAAVRAITPERIQTAAQKYLSTKQIGVAVAGP